MTEAFGGGIPRGDHGDDSIRVQLSRRAVAMPQRDIDAYGPALAKLFPDTDVFAAEGLLAAYDEEEDEL